MASLVFNHAWDQMIRGALDMDGGTFKVLLTTSGYVENKDTHEDRADVTNEVANGNGYTTGGNTATVTVTKDNANDRVVVQLGGTTWTAGAGQTLTARKAVYYLSTGTAANDLLVAVVDFGTDQVASNGTLTLNPSTITLQN
jgi:hypothetical protein